MVRLRRTQPINGFFLEIRFEPFRASFAPKFRLLISPKRNIECHLNSVHTNISGLDPTSDRLADSTKTYRMEKLICEPRTSNSDYLHLTGWLIGHKFALVFALGVFL